MTSCPHWEKQFEGKSDLQWKDGPTPETCRAEWSLTVTNSSVRSIDVQRVVVRMWRFDLPVPTSDKPAYADEYAAEPKDKTDPKEFLDLKIFTDPDDPLVDKYGPGGVSDTTYIWVFRRPPRPTWVSLEVELYLDKEGTKTIWFAGETSQMCAP